MLNFVFSCLLTYHTKELSGKLGAVFIPQNQPGGGEASFAVISIISELRVCGMLVYSSGIAEGNPILHFGAISQKAPTENTLDYDRCLKLGTGILSTVAINFKIQLNFIFTSLSRVLKKSR
jgi:hypothetical protein